MFSKIFEFDNIQQFNEICSNKGNKMTKDKEYKEKDDSEQDDEDVKKSKKSSKKKDSKNGDSPEGIEEDTSSDTYKTTPVDVTIQQTATNFVIDSLESLLARIRSGMSSNLKMEAINKFIEEEESLNEEFKKKAPALIQATLAEITEGLLKEFKDAAQKDVEASVVLVQESYKNELEVLEEKMKTYVEYVADEQFALNKEITHDKLVAENNAKIVEGIKSLFTENYTVIPQESRDLHKELEEKYASKVVEIDSLVNQLKEAKKQVELLKSEQKINESLEGIPLTQHESFKTMANGYDMLAEDFSQKLEILKEHFLKSTPSKTANKTLLEESELKGTVDDKDSPLVAAIKRMAKK